MKDLEINSIEKAKNLLGIHEDLPLDVLYDQLYDYRNSQHPDKFSDETAQNKAEENFKEAGEILESIKKKIELQLVERKPSEVIQLQSKIDSIQIKQHNVEYQNEIKNLKTSVFLKNHEIKDLKRELNVLRNTKLEEKKDELINLYKPSKKGLFSSGIIFILTLLGTIITKIEDIALIINKYSPIPESVFNIILFSILAFIPLRLIFLFFRKKVFEHIAQLIISPPFINLFLDQLVSSGKKEEFTELDVFNFLSRLRFPKKSFLRWLYNNIFNLKSTKTLNEIKDIFIYNLLSKQLIEISSADNLDRKFKIIKSRYYFSLDEEDSTFPF